eukprot:jgi/Orpsp1_1/1175711/evm.model.c7180000054922.1
MNNNTQNNKPQSGRGNKGNKINPLNRINFNRGILNNSNNNIKDIRSIEEQKIKENLQLLPEWLSNAVKKIEGPNYNTNAFFIENYQKIATNEMEYFDENPDHQTVNAATSLLNESRNRYMNVYPYDYNRIKLVNESFVTSNETSDFINASLIINPYTGKQSYIATQGPIKETCGDFWQMVWEQNSYLIVMVAREMENNIIKCAVYWPTEEGLVYELNLPSQYNNNKIQRKLELVLKNTSQPTENIIKRIIEITEVEFDKIEN